MEVFQESIIPDRRSNQFKLKCAGDVKSFQSIFSYSVALSLRGWAWEQVCPELHCGGGGGGGLPNLCVCMCVRMCDSASTE